MQPLQSEPVGSAASFIIRKTASIRDGVRNAWPLAFAGIAALTGCSALGPGSAAMGKPPEIKASVAAATSRTIADFSSELRCMDKLLLDFGTRDLSVRVENLVDRSKNVNPGATDMLVSAVANMTRTSRGIRLVVQHQGLGNVAVVGSETPEHLAVQPQYVLGGSISEIDNATPGRDVNGGASINLTLLTTQNRSIVAGVASRHSLTMFKSGKDFDNTAEITTFGVTFKLPIGSQAQASRMLTELASIELFGRLAKVPYWTCLGATSDNEAVATETQDWFDAMVARPAEIVAYFQEQLRLRRVYAGPIDGLVNPQIKRAVAAYREVLGLSHEPKLSLDFFRAHLGANHGQVAERLQQVPASGDAAATAAQSAASSITTRLAVRIATANDVHRFARGEAVQLTVQPNRDAYVLCFHQDENQQIRRFFPNRFQRDPRVDPAKGLQLPGAMRFEIRMNPRGVQETVSCFATERDVLPELPSGLSLGDFEPLPVVSLEQVRSALVSVTHGEMAQESFQILSK